MFEKENEFAPVGVALAIGTIAPCIEAADDEASDTGIRLSHLPLAPKCQCHA